MAREPYNFPHDGSEHTPPLDESAFITASDYVRQYRSDYVDASDSVVRSSRLHPSQVGPLAVGAWLIEDRFTTPYGRPVEVYLLVDPQALEVSEDVSPRMDDALRYRDWIREGRVPPPVSTVETEAGRLRVTDGHRRRHASLLAETRVPAWVSPSAPIPGLSDSAGRPIITGLTFELAAYYMLESGRDVGESARRAILSASELISKIRKAGRDVAP